MTELVENAFDCKVLLKRTLLCSTAGLSLLALAKSEMTSVAPIANLFSTISNLKRHTIYFPEGFIHGELEPGVLEFYWERTLPGILKLLAHNDIDPRILSTYEPECRDYLTRELAELWRRGVAEEKLFPVSFHEAVAILERCIWFYLSYNPKLGGSAYEFLQMTGPRGKERVARIRAIANEVLYGPDSLHVQSDLPEWLRERIVEAIWTVAGILADYGTQGLMTLARIIHTHSCAILRIGIS